MGQREPSGSGASGSTHHARRKSSTDAEPSRRHFLLAAGWVALAVVVQRALLIEGEGASFDPFSILGVSSVRLRSASPGLDREPELT